MWIKKTESEKIEEEKKEKESYEKNKFRKPLKYSFWIFVFFIVVMPLSYVYVGIPNGRFNPAPRARIDWAELPNYYPRILAQAISLFIFTFILMIIVKDRKTKSRTLICEKCFKTKKYSENTICECGGHLDFLDNYKWVENIEND
ncbi:MAG TPA: hypothetical protein PKL96_11765 [Bacteroidales bacterium]|nr:hypothetical protein [Bacteroidales bacterium]